MASAEPTSSAEFSDITVAQPLTPQNDKFAKRMCDAYFRGYIFKLLGIANDTSGIGACGISQLHSLHSLAHHLSLYVLGQRRLPQMAYMIQKQVRKYYHDSELPMSALVVDYFYNHTEKPFEMRQLVVESVAVRIQSFAPHSQLEHRPLVVGLYASYCTVSGLSKRMQEIIKRQDDFARNPWVKLVNFAAVRVQGLNICMPIGADIGDGESEDYSSPCRT